MVCFKNIPDLFCSCGDIQPAYGQLKGLLYKICLILFVRVEIYSLWPEDS